MATYKEIQGFTIQALASDPAASADTEGQVWYNTTTGVLKVVVDDGGYTVKTITAS
jgi:hypothetical protein|tara:strand:- start:361 stop:528 length:168 start_codon:yes stop_codon:yes gene_type:complete